MKHIHCFQHTGGGCNINTTLPDSWSQCDDLYECECGAKFRATSDSATHFTMPRYIAGKEEPEDMEVNTD